jgi:poly(3-hydroxybutyrate) depolymerase
VIVENGNHNWPDLKQDGFSATDALWAFFATHPKAQSQTKDQQQKN